MRILSLTSAASCLALLAAACTPADEPEQAATEIEPAAEEEIAALEDGADMEPASDEPEMDADIDYAYRDDRVADILTVQDALEAYRDAHGDYPVSDEYQGYASAWGASLGEDWLPELEPYLNDLPRDPAMSEDPQGPQYIYYSDGEDYKLLAHQIDDCDPDMDAGGVLPDPVRGCIAYGVWTEGGQGF